MKSHPKLLAAYLAILLPLSSPAAPVGDEDRVPLDLRRTTIVVGNMERSLAFYRDALGMVVTYDNMIYTPRDAASAEEAERVSRLVFLRANDDFIGVLGLLEYQKPVREPVDLSEKVFHPGTTVLVFNLEDNEAAFERGRQVEGVNVLWEPTEVSYPSYDGKGAIRVRASGLQDPDGIAVEINQLLDELR